jgi:fido (protein-threonine AMPylation protein)
VLTLSLLFVKNRLDEKPIPAMRNCPSQPPSEAEALYNRFAAETRQRGVEPALLIAAALDTAAGGFVQLDILKNWLDSFRPLPPVVVAELKQFYTVQMTYHSNAIEGNTLTQSETEMVLSHGITIGGKTLVEHLEVISHRDAMEYVEELARQNTPIGEWELKTLHSLILHPVDQATGNNEAGRYRMLDVRSAGTKYEYPPHYQVPELMTEFVTWLNSAAAHKLHPVEYAAEVHYRFVAIHPFRDGNGRSGRLLMNLCLLRAGYPITVITNEQRLDYIGALVHAQNHGDDTGLLAQLVAGACRTSLLDYLGVLSTAGDSRGLGAAFYRAVLASLPR